jgi:DNA-binding PadR family transcriptional regulator
MFNKHFFKHERHSRLFEKGDLKYVILDLLKEKPSHGYEIIRALEDRFHGFYTPSAGSVYPTLQMLEDMGHVKSVEKDDKKIYEITGQGIKFLNEQGEEVSRIKSHMKSWMGPRDHTEFRETMHELGRIGHLVGHRMHRLSPEQLSRVKEIISRACKEIEEIVEK